MPTIGLGGDRHLITCIDVATQFAAAMPVVSSDEIPKLIDATVQNFFEDYSRTPNILVSKTAADNLLPRSADPPDVQLCPRSDVFILCRGKRNSGAPERYPPGSCPQGAS